MFATGVTMGLAEWIIDDTCLVVFVSLVMSMRIPKMFGLVNLSNLFLF